LARLPLKNFLALGAITASRCDLDSIAKEFWGLFKNNIAKIDAKRRSDFEDIWVFGDGGEFGV